MSKKYQTISEFKKKYVSPYQYFDLDSLSDQERIDIDHLYQKIDSEFTFYLMVHWYPKEDLEKEIKDVSEQIAKILYG